MKDDIIEWQIENFNSLCDKAKFLIFKNIMECEPNDINFFTVYEINDDETKLTPIEQILCIAFKLYELYSKQRTPRPSFVDIQHPIKCNENNYIVDFFIDTIILPTEEYEVFLNKPIAIECDGFDYHSNKKQMNNDYKRENDLKLAGYNVIRFTGSQIYNTPFECVEVVYKELENVFKNKEYNSGEDNE